jgi:hypothetical protein
VKSESPTFYEFEGPLSAEGPVWRMELGAPEPETGQKTRDATPTSAQ